MEREVLWKPWGLVQAQSSGSWGWRVSVILVPKGSSARKTSSDPMTGRGTKALGRRAAAVATPWVAGSIRDILVSYVQRWAWVRGVRKPLDSIVT